MDVRGEQLGVYRRADRSVRAFVPERPAITCPVCGMDCEDRGNDQYRCVGDDEHEFTAGKCPTCGKMEYVFQGVTACRNPHCSTRTVNGPGQELSRNPARA